jgi:major membrane immunogen (membrane-anchored lipoprotein)
MKVFVLLWIGFSLSFACGCLDSPSESMYTQEGKQHYNQEDNGMKQEFIEIAKQLKEAYEEFENKSAKLIEDNAKIKFLETVSKAQQSFLFNKNKELTAIENESFSQRVQKELKLKEIQ